MGWDDSYPKENFLEGKQPPEDGAWLVKNGWGVGSEESPNWGDWGVDEDDDGVGDGYFWLSYYDMGLTFQPETFDFNVEEPGASYYHVAQYDFMPTVDIASTESSTPARMANVFVAEEPQMLRALSVNTAQQSVDGSDVAKDTFWVPEAEYLLLEGAIAGAQSALALEDPTLGEIDLARESLQLAMDTFAAAKKPGSKEAGEQKPPAGTETDAGKGDGTASDESNADDSGDAAAPLAGTGDGGGLVSVGIVAAAGAGALALAARRVRNDEGREIS